MAKKKAAKSITGGKSPSRPRGVRNVSKALDEFHSRMLKTAPPASSTTKHKGRLCDPFKEGVTYSSCSLFDIDRVAYHAAYEQGFTDEKPGDGLKFGQFFHDLIDRYDGQKNIPDSAQCLIDLEPRRLKLLNSVKTQEECDNIAKLVGLAAVMFPTYLQFWNDPANSVFPDGLTDVHIEWLGKEEKFRFEHKPFASKPPIPHNGRMDGRFRFRSPYSKRCPEVRQVLLETKTQADRWAKSKAELDATCHTYAQVNFYALAMLHATGELPTHVLYNVIKRPGHKPLTGRATKANGMKKIPETTSEFVDRVGADIASRPQDYFIRSFRTIPPGQVERWVQYEHNGLLKDMIDRWESIKANPDQPHLRVREDGATVVNFAHRARYKGIFDPEEAGLHQRLFDPLTAHSRAGLIVRDAPFPELADD